MNGKGGQAALCLINFQLHDHPNYKLIVAANRDEFYGRPTSPAKIWKDEPEILAGRDLMQMGTWLGITKQGRFAALTNYRHPEHMGAGRFSRGEIVKNYLTEGSSPRDFLESLRDNKEDYTGFNVIVGDPDQLFHYHNVNDEITKITSGTHSLSNDTLNTPWPKVIKGRENLKNYTKNQKEVHSEELFKIVADAEQAPDEHLPETGVGLDFERKLSPMFIQTPDYGTRTSTVLLIDKSNHVTFVERTFEKGELSDENHFSFQIEEGS